jgi:alpha-beta hydrolase superfamily lysophospholipase
LAEIGGDFTVEDFTASDGYTCRFRHYRPAGQPRAVVVGIHGIQSHAGWYGNSCARLCEAHFDVCFVDRRGSGLNEQARGDAPSFRRLLDDLAEFLAHCRGRRVPVFLMAISWGGKLAVALERRHPGLVDGLALLCPGFFPKVGPTMRRRLGILAARFYRPKKLFPIPLDDPELFTANPHWLAFLRHDPLSLHHATARLLLESARLDGYLRFCPRYVTVPVLLLLAGKDRIIHNGPTRRFIERFRTADKKIIEYDQAHHTLEFEPDPRPFIQDLVTWLVEKSKTSD